MFGAPSGTILDSLFMERRMEKRRQTGVTEIRGPSHSFMGPHYLEEILESTGSFVDGLKFMGGSSSLMPHYLVKDMVRLAHNHGIYVSTGGWSEHVLGTGRKSFKQYVKGCKELGFDMIEFDTHSDKLSEEDFIYLTRMAKNQGLKVKPELFVGDEDVESIIDRAERLLGAGADVIMVESEGLTDKAKPWQTDVIAKLIERLGLDKIMFEAADPNVFEWYIRKYGTGVNLFVDHAHILQLERLRSGRWGMGEHRRRFIL